MLLTPSSNVPFSNEPSPSVTIDCSCTDKSPHEDNQVTQSLSPTAL